MIRQTNVNRKSVRRLLDEAQSGSGVALQLLVIVSSSLLFLDPPFALSSIEERQEPGAPVVLAGICAVGAG
jgi:hypothetical protein